MAFMPRPRRSNIHRPEITMDEFKKQPERYDDTGRDGRISSDELQEAIHSSGAFVVRSSHRGLNGEISMDEFKKWLKVYDGDNDGRISVHELRKAIRDSGGWFSKAKARRVIHSVDKNSNRFIDEDEISMLLVFAHKQFGFNIVA